MIKKDDKIAVEVKTEKEANDVYNKAIKIG